MDAARSVADPVSDDRALDDRASDVHDPARREEPVSGEPWNKITSGQFFTATRGEQHEQYEPYGGLG